jgi:hypothetical protein
MSLFRKGSARETGQRRERDDDPSIESFILAFDGDMPETAPYLAALLDKYGTGAFYSQLISLIKARILNRSDIDDDSRWRICGFIYFIHAFASRVPGYDCEKLKKKAIETGEVGELLKESFLRNNDTRFRWYVIVNFFHIRGIFSDAQMGEIEGLIFKSEWILVRDYFLARFADLDRRRIVSMAIDTKNRYLVWGIIDCFIEQMNIEFEDHVRALEALNDIVLKERVRYYRVKKDITNKMYDENRLDPTQEERKALGSSIFDFSRFHDFVLASDFEVHYGEMDLDAIVRKMWNGA